MHYEREIRQKGFQRVAGVDEAGRGPMAGPVVAAACHIPEGILFKGVNDSKQISADLRAELYEQITTHSDVSFGVSIVGPEIIDEINILQASIRAMIQAVDQMPHPPDFLLVDGLKLPHPIHPCLKLVKGDALSYSIAAASIIAKVTRDRLMLELHQLYPQYGFDQHKGYGTAHHREMYKKHGPSPVHRKTFSFKE